MATITDVPGFEAYMWPIIERLKANGRSMTNAEMLEDVAQHMDLTEAVLNVRVGKWNELAVAQRLGFARSWLKLGGAVTNSQRGVWTLTPLGAGMTPQEVAAIPKKVQRDYVRKSKTETLDNGPIDLIAAEDVAGDWKDQLMVHLTALEPAAFERLCQRLLLSLIHI